MERERWISGGASSDGDDGSEERIEAAEAEARETWLLYARIVHGEFADII